MVLFKAINVIISFILMMFAFSGILEDKKRMANYITFIFMLSVFVYIVIS
jgi:hypothetical protein